MAIAITAATPADPSAAGVAQAPPVQKSATQSQQTTQSQPQSTDTVKITNAGQTALQESLEPQTQTATEASKGDHQAQRLLAKELAAQKT